MTRNAEPRTVDHGQPPRGSLRLLVDRQFGALFWGKLLGNTGTWIFGVVAAIVVFTATESALWVGLVSVVQFTPQLVLGPLSGKWADRGNVGRQLILGRLLGAIGSGALAVYCYLAGELSGTGDAIPVLVASLVVGLGFVVGGPAQQSIVPLLIRPGELSRAMALNALPMTLARVTGPAIGAVVVVQMGAGDAFLIAALANAAFVGLLFLARLPTGVTSADDTDFSVRAAFAHVRQDRTLLLLLLVVAATGIAAEPSITLAPTFASELGAGTVVVGQVTGSFGIGAAVGYFVLSLASRRYSHPRLAQVGLVLMAVGSIALAFSPDVVSTLVLFGALGVGFMLANTTATTLILQRVPPVLRGRVMALWFIAFVGARPLAAAGAGVLADLFSRSAPMLVITAGLVALLAFFRLSRLDFSARSQVHEPPPHAAPDQP